MKEWTSIAWGHWICPKDAFGWNIFQFLLIVALSTHEPQEDLAPVFPAKMVVETIQERTRKRELIKEWNKLVKQEAILGSRRTRWETINHHNHAHRRDLDIEQTYERIIELNERAEQRLE